MVRPALTRRVRVLSLRDAVGAAVRRGVEPEAEAPFPSASHATTHTTTHTIPINLITTTHTIRITPTIHTRHKHDFCPHG